MTKLIKFGLQNPQISVLEIPNPELNPQIMCNRIARLLSEALHLGDSHVVAQYNNERGRWELRLRFLKFLEQSALTLKTYNWHCIKEWRGF